jgi:hypothetical protein
MAASSTDRFNLVEKAWVPIRLKAEWARTENIKE